ncbi:MAG: Ig-like domain-containing protein, partial [Phycisphaerales bacterium]|nr:Ig-like domain-containing protein [Phycisphaerales bacterium]
LRDYRAANLYSTATTAQFQAVCESVYGSSLDWFFQPWVYQVGAPTYQYAGRTVTVNGRSFIEVFVQQVQGDAWPTFTMPLDVRATIAGVPTTVVVRNDARREHLLAPAPAGALGQLDLDPDVWVLTVASSTSTALSGSKTLVAFPEGPPKITEVSPAPLSNAPAGSVPDVRVWFHKPVNAATATGAGAVMLTGQSRGAVPVTVTLTGAGQQLTVTPTGGVLPPDTYTLTIAQTVTDSASGQQLDGEVVAGALPSGDGLPGGAAVITFTVDPCGQADVGSQGGLAGADGRLDNNDFIAFISLFFAQDLRADAGRQGGLTGSDGQLDNNDFIAFISLFFAGC